MRLAAALLAALLLVSCSSPTPSQSIPASQNEITAAYLHLVEASNADTCGFNAVLSQSAPALADLKAASAEYATSLDALANGLSALAWPPDSQADASALVDALRINHGFAEAMAAASTLDAFIQADNQLIEANKVSTAAATRLRTDLGLAPAGNPCS